MKSNREIFEWFKSFIRERDDCVMSGDYVVSSRSGWLKTLRLFRIETYSESVALELLGIYTKCMKELLDSNQIEEYRVKPLTCDNPYVLNSFIRGYDIIDSSAVLVLGVDIVVKPKISGEFNSTSSGHLVRDVNSLVAEKLLCLYSNKYKLVNNIEDLVDVYLLSTLNILDYSKIGELSKNYLNIHKKCLLETKDFKPEEISNYLYNIVKSHKYYQICIVGYGIKEKNIFKSVLRLVGVFER